MTSDDERRPGERPPSSEPHRELRERLGAYVLGALDPEERIEVEGHLDGCSSCRDELSRLSPLPPLLDRVSVEEVEGGALRPPAGLLDGLLGRIEREHRRDRRRLRAWQTVAAAALAAVALVLWAPWEAPPSFDALVAPAQPAAAAVEGEAALMAWEWGTTVRLDVAGLPERDTYELWAVAEDGRREQAGTWGPTADRSARVMGASSILRHTLAHVEITDTAGEVLAVFEPPTG